MIEFLPPPPVISGVNRDGVRELTPEEIKTVEHVFHATGNPLPDPAISTFIGAVRDGKVVGFLVLQVKLHAQPLWLEQGHSDLFAPIVSAAERHIIAKAGPQWVYCFAPAGKLSQMAQTMGMQLEPWCVLSKLVQPEAPSKSVIELPTPSENDVSEAMLDHTPVDGESIQ